MFCKTDNDTSNRGFCATTDKQSDLVCDLLVRAHTKAHPNTADVVKI